MVPNLVRTMLARIFISLFMGYAASVYADTSRLNLEVHGLTISVEVAATPTARARGLMYRQHLARDAGMLFIFPEPGYHTMWMSNTHLPLSAAFLDERGVIINIADMMPLTTVEHAPIAPAKFVLEMNQGWFKTRGIEAGHRVRGLPHAKEK